jgi:DNA mismatch endonuclease (patch repair protein)
MPKSRLHFWRPKLEQNRKRDIQAQRRLKREGWRILIIWECEIKAANLADRIDRFLEAN